MASDNIELRIERAGNVVTLVWPHTSANEDAVDDLWERLCETFGDTPPLDGVEICLSGGPWSCHTRVFGRGKS